MNDRRGELTARIRSMPDVAVRALDEFSRGLCPCCSAPAKIRSSRVVENRRCIYFICPECSTRFTRLMSRDNGEGFSTARRPRIIEQSTPETTTSKVSTYMRLQMGRQKLNAASKALECSLAYSSKLPDLEGWYDVATLNAMSDTYPHGMTLRGALEETARSKGEYTSGLTTEEMFRAAFRPSFQAADYSTISLDGVLGNLSGKHMINAFESVEHGWKRLVKVRPASDFKTLKSYALTGNAQLLPVGNAGELAHASMGETSYTAQLETLGRVLSISRQDILNDDMGALLDGSAQLGYGAGLSLNHVVWTQFLSGASTLFSSGNGNYLSGGSSALTSTSLQTALTAFRTQTTPDKKPIGVAARYLLIPPQLEVTAAQIVHGMMNVGDTPDLDGAPSQSSSGLTNKFDIVSSSYLSNSEYAGSSSSAWWLLADPRLLPVLLIAYLNGNENPTIQTSDVDMNGIGIRFRVFFDFGCGLGDSRSGVMSAGA